MNDNPANAPAKPPVEDLGHEFEVLEEAARSSVAAVAAAPSPQPPPGGVIQPLRSGAAWGSLGIGIAVAGLIGPWNDVGANLLHGLLFAWGIWFLLRDGYAAVQPSWKLPSIYLAAALAGYGLLRLVLGGGQASLFGWHAGGPLAAFGALLTLVGGAIAAAAPFLGKAKDAKLPALPPAPPRDPQFSQSLFAYLVILASLLMPWGSAGERGVDSGLGAVTLACVLLALWACWSGVWKLWTTPLVTGGRMGFMLFLAPLEALLLGLFGLGRWSGSDAFLKAWPGDPETEALLVYGAGPLLTLLGGGFATYLLFHGVRAATAMNKQRKADEMAARKAARDAKKGGAEVRQA
ncbi:MAG: hypothetical protein EYC70_04240 [Planctomycetota bacterium]|nr:MAG: hypothetical protein EYC70_04240 [Planctomycetota bacterium]